MEQIELHGIKEYYYIDQQGAKWLLTRKQYYKGILVATPYDNIRVYLNSIIVYSRISSTLPTQKKQRKLADFLANKIRLENNFENIRKLKMEKSVAELNKEAKEQHGTLQNTYEMFPVGTPVKIICLAQDFHFFDGETGVVISNSGKYLGIRVKFDEPRHFEDFTQTEFGFKPEDLVRLGDELETKCKHCATCTCEE